jgi:hypothetical protein
MKHQPFVSNVIEVTSLGHKPLSPPRHNVCRIVATDGNTCRNLVFISYKCGYILYRTSKGDEVRVVDDLL